MGYKLKSVNVRCRQRKQHVNLTLLILLLPQRTFNQIYVIVSLYWVDLQKLFLIPKQTKKKKLCSPWENIKLCFQKLLPAGLPQPNLSNWTEVMCYMLRSRRSPNFWSNICREIISQRKNMFIVTEIRKLASFKIFLLHWVFFIH